MGTGAAMMTRRAFLAASAGLAAAACGGSNGRIVRGQGPSGPTKTSPSPPTTLPIGSSLTKVPTLALPPATKPAFFVKDVISSPPPSAAALTIDDGPDPRYTPAVLAILAEFGIHANFCVIGQSANRFPGLLLDIINQGHSLTNHTMNHPQQFASLSTERLREEIVGGLEAIYDATGGFVSSTFRSPGGEWSPAVYDLLGELGMIPIDWNVDPRDFSRPGVSAITAKLLRANPGDILLCHDGGGDRSETVTALRTVIPALQKRGLTFVTL